MTKIEYSILMYRRLSHIEIRPQQVNYKRVEEPVYEFLEKLRSFLEIWTGKSLFQGSFGWSEPGDVRDLTCQTDGERNSRQGGRGDGL
jgi:hypothetical protein